MIKKIVSCLLGIILVSVGCTSVSGCSTPSKELVFDFNPKIATDSFSANTAYSLAIDKKGNIWGWGHNDYGQIGTGKKLEYEGPWPTLEETHQNDEYAPVQITKGTRFISVITCLRFSYAVDEDGNLWGWGAVRAGCSTAKEYKELYEENGFLAPTMILKGTKVSKVVCADFNTFMIDAEGKLWGWGSNNHGALGQGYTPNFAQVDESAKPLPIMPERRFIDVAAGYYCGFAVDEEGGLWSWGSNEFGQLGTGTFTGEFNFEGVSTPQHVMPKVRFTRVCASYSATFAFDEDGALWACGSNGVFRGLGTGSSEKRCPTFAKVKTDARFVYVAPDFNATFAIDEAGHLWAWGSNANQRLLTETEDKVQPTPVLVLPLQDVRFTQVSHDVYHGMLLSEDGTIFSWGDSNNCGAIGNGTNTPYDDFYRIRLGK